MDWQKTGRGFQDIDILKLYKFALSKDLNTLTMICYADSPVFLTEFYNWVFVNFVKQGAPCLEEIGYERAQMCFTALHRPMNLPNANLVQFHSHMSGFMFKIFHEPAEIDKQKDCVRREKWSCFSLQDRRIENQDMITIKIYRAILKYQGEDARQGMMGSSWKVPVLQLLIVITT